MAYLEKLIHNRQIGQHMLYRYYMLINMLCGKEIYLEHCQDLISSRPEFDWNLFEIATVYSCFLPRDSAVSCSLL